MTILKIMCGCPAAGKTTYIKNYANKEDLIISRDKIRKSIITPGIPYFSKESEVFKEFCTQINNGVNKYHVIWVDATHLNNKSRWKLLYNINRFDFEKIIFICIETSLNECLKRNKKRIETSFVPEESLIQMYNSYKRPSLNDFLSLPVEIIVVKNKSDN